jgi:hypothetical protein
LVLRLEEKGRIPKDRPDLLSELAKREEDYKRLTQRIAELKQSVQQLPLKISGDRERLEVLLEWLHELPGLRLLHEVIFLQALKTRDLALAEKHVHWADKLFPKDERVGTLRVYHMFVLGRFDQAGKVGMEMLGPESPPPLRYLVALSLIASSNDLFLQKEKALEVLEPLLAENTELSNWKLLGLALAMSINHDFNRPADLERYLTLFNSLFEALPIEDQHRLARIREVVKKSESSLRKELMNLNGHSEFSSPEAEIESQLRKELMNLNEPFFVYSSHDQVDGHDEPPLGHEHFSLLATA